MEELRASDTREFALTLQFFTTDMHWVFTRKSEAKEEIGESPPPPHRHAGGDQLPPKGKHKALTSSPETSLAEPKS